MWVLSRLGEEFLIVIGLLNEECDQPSTEDI
jgi:hypothetical protein